MNITEKIISDIKQHAAEAYPQEACGIITSKSRYVRMENTAADPKKDFRIEPAEMLKYEVGAVVHSHPGGPCYPSESDMAGQIATAVPWGICIVDSAGEVSTPFFWGSSEFMPPLLGRSFRHGPSGSDGCGDCYALIRDWYLLERGIKLQEYPRADGWWEKGQNLYENFFQEAGFYEIRAEEAREGDVFMGRVLCSKINHAGILLEDGLILHHLAGRESRREPVGRWMKLIDKWVRYRD